MLTYILEKKKKEPLYEQLYKYIRNDILQGVLASGKRLPSKRSLAENLDVSVITVEQAYHQLSAEGYIFSRARCGYFVSEIENNKLSEEITYKDTDSERKNYKYEFRMNTTDTEYFPFSTWAKILKFVLSEKDKMLLEKTGVKGVYELRCQIAEYLRQFRGINASPSQIVTGAGSEYLILLLLQILGRERVYALENPGYLKVSKILEKNNIKTEKIPLDDNGMIIEKLYLSGADIAHVTPSHHFPLGITMPIGRRQELLRWAEGKQGYIIEDDYDSEFRYTGHPIPALKSLDSKGRVIYLNTFAKSLAPSLRISYMVLPDRLMEIFERDFAFYSNTVSSFEQYTLAYFMKRGHFERYVNRMRVVYKKRCSLICDRITKGKFKNRTIIYGQKEGMHLVLAFKVNMTEEEIAEKAAKRGVLVYPTENFCGKHFFKSDDFPRILIGFSAIKCEDIEKAFDILEEVIFGRE